MKKLVMFAIASTICGTAAAETVDISSSGVLSTGDGMYSAGDRFSFRTSYDDAVPPQFTEDGLAFYDPADFFNFTVNDDTYLLSVIFNTVYNSSGSTLFIGAPGNTSPQGHVTINVERSDPTNLSLPSAAELNGKSGEFSFFVAGPPDPPLFGSGGGIAPVTAVPEPSTWAMMLLGFGAVGLVMRRRRHCVEGA